MCLSLSSQSCFSFSQSVCCSCVFSFFSSPFSNFTSWTTTAETDMKRLSLKDQNSWSPFFFDNRSRGRNGETRELLPFLLCFSSVKVVRERKSLNRSNHFLSFLFLSNFSFPLLESDMLKESQESSFPFLSSRVIVPSPPCLLSSSEQRRNWWTMTTMSFFFLYIPFLLIFSRERLSPSLLTLANNDAQVNCFSSSLPARLSGNIIIDNDDDDDRSSLSS